jgi:hypothetical protein
LADDVARVGSDEIGRDEAFERRWHLAQRIAWGILAAFVLAGLAGIFGQGPLSSIRVASSSGIVTLRYARFARYEAPVALKVGIGPRAAARGEITLLVSGGLVAALRIERTSPRPLWVTASPGDERFAFLAAGPGKRTSVEFSEEPRRIGHLTGGLQVGNGAGGVAVSQVVYP